MRTTEHLLRQFDWPYQQHPGSLRWDRALDAHQGWARGKVSAHAVVQWKGQALTVRVEHKNADGSLTPILEAHWDVPAGKPPLLVRFEHRGEAQELCARTAINRFRGQTLLMNVPPRWGC